MNWDILREVIKPEHLDMIYSYCKEKSKEQFKFEEAFPNVPSFYNDAMMKVIHKRLIPVVSNAWELDLQASYTFWRMYKWGDIMYKHIDRPACEYSCTMSVGYEGDGWDILLYDGEETNIIKLKPGDMLLYKGCELPHWREKYEGGGLNAQAFFHYVDMNGPNKACKWDGKEAY